MSKPSTRLTVITNRAPYAVRRRGRQRELVRSVGGLSVTLDDLLRRRGGTWLAWSGSGGREKGRYVRPPLQIHTLPSENGSPYRLKLLGLSEPEVAGFYHAFSNRSLWPLCHYFLGRSHFDVEDWQMYRRVNQVFVRAAARLVPRGGLAWVHDFHLALVPAGLRAARPDVHIAVFWHIPFPAPAVFRVLPWSKDLIAGLLGADLIGFHTTEYADHFLQCVAQVVGAEIDAEERSIRYGGRKIQIGAYPLGVEAETFSRLGVDRSVVQEAQRLRSRIGVEKILLGVDRLDYTKGVLERLKAYEFLLKDHPDLHGKVCLLQIQVPSREAVPEYRTLREQIDRTVGRIVGRFSSASWTPLRYLHRGFSRSDLAAFYRAADVLLVTPLRDGMNLVAKEYVATRADEDGVLVLSEFAGAAAQLPEAMHVNPFDITGLANNLHDALGVATRERRSSMRALRRRVFAEDVDWWVEQFLGDAATAGRRARTKRRRRRTKS